MVIENQKQLLDSCMELIKDKKFHHQHKPKHNLVITGRDNTPDEINQGGEVIHKEYIAISYEEADNIIVRQMVIAKKKPVGISMLSDDTDIFLLFLHHYLEQGLTSVVIYGIPSPRESCKRRLCYCKATPEHFTRTASSPCILRL